MKLYEKFVNGERHCKPISKIILIKNGMQIFNPTEDMLIEDGWVEHVSNNNPKEIENIKRTEEIDLLKETLSSSDYKIIKCMEAFLCGEDLP